MANEKQEALRVGGLIQAGVRILVCAGAGGGVGAGVAGLIILLTHPGGAQVGLALGSFTVVGALAGGYAGAGGQEEKNLMNTDKQGEALSGTTIEREMTIVVRGGMEAFKRFLALHDAPKEGGGQQEGSRICACGVGAIWKEGRIVEVANSACDCPCHERGYLSPARQESRRA